MKLKWIILGGNLPNLEIRADSFDEAIGKARKLNENYCGGYVADDADDEEVRT